MSPIELALPGALRIGVDVGGTNTDAVAMAGNEVMGWAKATTTPEVTEGIVTAVRVLLEGTVCRPTRSGP